MELTHKAHGNIFEAVRFAALAVSKDKMAPGVLRTIDITPGVIQATDGHRMHRATPEHWIPAGFYRVIKSSKASILIEKSEEQYSFPDCQAILNSIMQDNRTTHVFSHFSSDEHYQPYTEIVRKMDNEITLNYQYVSDALSGGATTFSVHNTSGVHIINDAATLQAVVMPCKIIRS